MQTDDTFQWDDATVIAFIKDLYDRHPNNEMLAKIQDFKNRQAKPNEWEILRFRCSGLGATFITKGEEGIEWNVPAMLKDSRYIIDSVIRLSDKEVFTVGDDTDKGVIKRIAITPFEVLYFDCGGDINRGVFSLKHLRKVAKPILFTTEDGVAIYDWHETVWYVNSAWHSGFRHAANYDVDSLSYMKYFSTEEKAKEYVIMNKPILSLKEILERSAIYGISTVMLENDLTDLAKSKINS